MVVVCFAAQEAGVPHPRVINRKNNNAIFTYTSSVILYTKPNNFCGGNATYLERRFRDLNLQKLVEFLWIFQSVKIVINLVH